MTLEFDHLDAKRGSVPGLAASGLSLAGLTQEIAGCEVVCVNCHRRRTAKRSQWRRAAPNWRLIATARTARETANIDFAYGVLERSGCIDCGMSELCVLDFDHVGRKQGHVIQLARNGWSRARLEREIAVCEVRCGNCHRRRTAQEAESYRTSRT